MAVARRGGDAGACDQLFSRIIRRGGACQRCGMQGTWQSFDTAHIISRRFRATRCELDNAWCLCRTCHQLVDAWWHLKEKMVDRTIGRRRYDELVVLANAHTKTSSAAFWRAERERLTALAQDLGVDTRRRIPT